MKKLILSLLTPGLLLAYQPAAPAPVHFPLRSAEALFLSAAPDLAPTPVMAIVPAVIIGAVVIGGVAWGGIKALNKALDIWEHKITNSPVPEVRFTLEDEYPE